MRTDDPRPDDELQVRVALLDEGGDRGSAAAGAQPGSVRVAPTVRRFVVGIVAAAAGLASVLVIYGIATDEPTVLDDSLSVPTIVAPVSTTTANTTVAPTSPAPVTEPPVVTFAESSALFETHPTGVLVGLWSFNDSRLVLIDLDGGTTTTLDLGSFGLDAVSRIEAMGDRLAVATRDGIGWVGVDGSFGELTSGRVEVWGDDEIWVTAPYAGNTAFIPSRIAIGEPEQGLAEVPARSGPFGFVDDRLVVGGGEAGGVFVLDPDDGFSRFADGGLLAWGPDAVMVRVCDDRLSCAVERVGTDGSSSRHELPPAFDLDGLWWIDRPAPPTVDAHLGVSLVSNRPVMWDLRTDELVPIAASQSRGVAWSRDGDWLFLGGVDELVALHRPTRTEVRVPVGVDVDLSEAMQVVALPRE